MNIVNRLGARVAAHLRAPLYANAYFLILNSLLPMASGFLFWMVASHLMPVEQVGLGAALLSASTLLISIFGLDLGTSLIRFVPNSLERSAERVNTVLWARGILAALSAAVFAMGVSIWAPGLAILTTDFRYVVLFVVGATAISVSEVLDHVFVAYRSAHFALWKNIIVSVGRFPVLIVVALVAVDRGGMSIFASVVASSAIAVALSIGKFMPRVYPTYTFTPIFSLPLVVDMAHFAAGNYLVNLLLQLPAMVLPLLTINLLGATSAGITYIVSTVAWSILVIPAAVSRSLLAEGSHRREHLAGQIQRSLYISLTLISIPSAILIALGPKALGLLYGPVYEQQGAGLLILLIISAPATVINAIYVSIKRIHNQLTDLIGVASIISLVSLGLCVLLVKKFGLNGMGIGLLGGQIVGVILTAREIVRVARQFPAQPEQV